MKLNNLIFNFFVAFSACLLWQIVSAQNVKVLKECADENLKILNEYRKTMGLGKLSMNSEARKRAEDHTKLMASSDHMYHSASSVYMDYENVAQEWMTDDEDQKDVGEKLFKGWKGSPGHNRNMLASDIKYAGIACVSFPSGYYDKVYATQIFWRRIHGGSSEQKPVSPTTVAPPTQDKEEPRPDPPSDDKPRETPGYDSDEDDNHRPSWYYWWKHGGDSGDSDENHSSNSGGHGQWFFKWFW